MFATSQLFAHGDGALFPAGIGVLAGAATQCMRALTYSLSKRIIRWGGCRFCTTVERDSQRNDVHRKTRQPGRKR